MNLWEYLDRRNARGTARPGIGFIGWIGIGLFIQSSGLFGLMAAKPDLLDNQGFMTVAGAVIITGWIGGAAAFAFTAGKRDGESNAVASKALDMAAAAMPPQAQAGAAAQDVADAAQGAADGIKGGI